MLRAAIRQTLFHQNVSRENSSNFKRQTVPIYGISQWTISCIGQRLFHVTQNIMWLHNTA